MSYIKESYIDFFNYYNYSDFRDIKLIENGSFGKIHCAKWKNIIVTLKAFNIQESALESFKEVVVVESQFHQRVNLHENISKFYGVASIGTGKNK
ncbi:unnamed protein product [Rhizophagus irregularis]|nr:unnamed protein product [Rhizophagus irregularis]